jgi:hypothetical protein
LKENRLLRKENLKNQEILGALLGMQAKLLIFINLFIYGFLNVLNI